MSSGGISHAVLFDQKETDSKKDGFYYFKNSYGPKNPFIKIENQRKTYIELRRANFNSATSPFWTIAELFLLRIKHV